DPVATQAVVLEHGLVLEEDLQVRGTDRGRGGVGDADLRRARGRPDVGGGEAGTSAPAAAGAPVRHGGNGAAATATAAPQAAAAAADLDVQRAPRDHRERAGDLLALPTGAAGAATGRGGPA